jgi:hypothetical protein
MATDISLSAARLGINLPLTTLAQSFIQPAMVMRLLFPLAEVPTYGGQIIQFDDSEYEDVEDARADDAPYPEIQSGYSGRPFKLNTKGLSYRVPDKRRKEMENLNLNWGQIARNQLMGRAVLKHETEAALVATTLNNYATTNRVTLTTGSQFNDAAVNPVRVIRTAKSAIASQIGVEGNVAIMGRSVYDELANRYANSFTSSEGVVRPDLTLTQLATILGVERAAVCDALVKRGGVKQRVMDKSMILGFTNPQALDIDRLPYVTDSAVTPMEMSYGYTYVMQGNPLMYEPYYDNDRGATVYKLDFDRKVVASAVDDSGLIIGGYLIQNAVA